MKNKRTSIRDLRQYIGEMVTIMGFVDTIRNQKRMQFLILRDHSGMVQTLHMKSKAERDSIGEAIASLTPESVITIHGKVVDAPQVKLGGLEVQISTIHVDSKAQSPLPIAKDSSLEKQLDWRQISLRTPENLLIFKVQTTLEQAMREYWYSNDFIEIHSPKLMGVASESGAELFEVPYFNDQMAYLAQSPQFYKQMAMAAGFDRVFEIGPVFRANPSFTSRHDTEFTSVDMEVAWITSYEDLMQLEEEWLHHVLTVIAQRHGESIRDMFGVDVVVPSLPFPRVSLHDARVLLEKEGHRIDHKVDLDPEGERLLGRVIREQYGHEFVFVTEYPSSVRAFYHMRHEEDAALTMGFDLLWKGLEITTGAQREHRLELLVRQAEELGVSLKPLEHYFNFFRYGCPPHGGFGVGLTRMLMNLLEKTNVREVTYLYRGPNRLTP